MLGLYGPNVKQTYLRKCLYDGANRLAIAWLEHMVTSMNRVLWKLLVMIPNRVWVMIRSLTEVNLVKGDRWEQ